MRIGIVTQHSFPEGQDYRCKKIAEALEARGHSVYVFTREIRGTLPPQSGIIVTSADARCNAPVPFSPYWTLWLAKQIRACQLDCLLSKQLRLAACVVAAARRCRVPWWLDLSENYRAMVDSERAGEWLMPIRKHFAGLLETYCARRADLVTVVTEPNRRRLMGLGVAPERLIVVSNTPPLALVQPAKNLDVGHARGPSSRGSNANGKVQFVFAGLLSKVRGLDRVLYAIQQLRAKSNGLHLNIIGDGPERENLLRLCDQLALSSFVTFHGWIPMPRLLQQISEYDVGIIPHLINGFTNTTIPNKLFDFMACGLPLLTTDMVPCREVVDSARCGWTCMDNAASFAATLGEILQLPREELVRMGERGRLAVQRNHNWEIDANRMISAVETLGKGVRTCTH
jgi:glycosyltransferase involved in cell wall biosynthesis